jgi:hypothetical protein
MPPPAGYVPTSPRTARAGAWLRTRTGVAVLVAAIMLIFGVVPAAAVGFVLGRVTDGGMMHHSRYDGPNGPMPGPGARWNDDDGYGQQNRQRQDRKVPLRPGKPAPTSPTTPAPPSAS